jgi:hypothetical protein
VVLALLLLWPWSAEAQSLDVRIEGDHLRISVMKVRLLAGDALQKLRDGATVTFVARLSTLSSRAGTVLGHVDYRFVVSYDIFEEKFQVTRILPSSRVVSHVSQATAEAAFSDGLELPIPGPNPNMPFWIRWEYQTETESPSGDVGLSLGGLVEIFSRKNANEPARAVVESGPHRLSDLPRISAPRGTR